MAVNLSALLLLGIAAIFIVKAKAGGIGPAIVLFLLGFFTAGTGADGPIRNLCASVFNFLTGLRP
ncbi:hypothetical protein QZH56_16415 [Streptomyces olivoreticuli]|uniref:hypothetical protein n=1 Tax=Streptomyces TaxID=1883 RepID=UPI00265A81A4|nr:hypothetical protein [Streptomyces olivoreticuli]WKK27030.1 hypothetical protein QZH56_16415 [Streptomyces olivoreticuli]